MLKTHLIRNIKRDKRHDYVYITRCASFEKLCRLIKKKLNQLQIF